MRVHGDRICMTYTDKQGVQKKDNLCNILVEGAQTIGTEWAPILQMCECCSSLDVCRSLRTSRGIDEVTPMLRHSHNWLQDRLELQPSSINELNSSIFPCSSVCSASVHARMQGSKDAYASKKGHRGSILVGRFTFFYIQLI